MNVCSRVNHVAFTFKDNTMIRVYFDGAIILETDDEAVLQAKIQEFEGKNPNRRAVRETVGGQEEVRFYFRAQESDPS